MAFTRKMQEDAFDHVITEVLTLTTSEVEGFKDAGINSIMAFVNMDDQAFATITKKDANNKQVPLATSTKILITVFMYYLHYLDELSETPIGKEWMKLTAEEFDAFRQGSVVKHYKGKTLDNVTTVTLKPSSLTTTTTTTAATMTAPKKVTDPVQEFDKGVKRDTTVFPSLKDE